jgi:hypothetical protein
MVYSPIILGIAPTDVAIFIICKLGPVRREVPESTMADVGPEENEPA